MGAVDPLSCLIHGNVEPVLIGRRSANAWVRV